MFRNIAAALATACLFSTQAFALGLHLVPMVSVVEFHNRILDHHFLTAEPDEIAAIARFYGTPAIGPNSHFYTGHADEAVGRFSLRLLPRR